MSFTNVAAPAAAAVAEPPPPETGAASATTTQTDAGPVTSVHLPVNVRNAALGVLAVLGVVFTLKWASVVLIPLALAAFLSYTLRPMVVQLRRRAQIPEPVGAALALIGALAMIASGAVALEPQASRFIDSLPALTKKLERTLHDSSLQKTSAVQKIIAAADGLERIAVTQGSTPSRVRSTPSSSEPLQLRRYLWSGTAAMVSALTQALLVLVLSYFLITSSQSLKRKMVRISGAALSTRKITVRILDEIDSQIQRYVLIQVATSALLGALTGVAFALIGLENAMLWGFAAGALHLIPYVGSAIVVVASALLAWLQFDTLNAVFLVVLSALAIAGIIGFGIVPWLTEKVGRINAVATLVSLMVWEWLWGIPGLLLGVPIMMAVMAVCERVENLKPFAELMSSDSAAEA